MKRDAKPDNEHSVNRDATSDIKRGLKRDTWTRRLCLLIIALCVVEFLVATLGVQIRQLPRSTDFATYYLAGSLAHDGESPYNGARMRQLAEQHQLGFEPFPFLYPPAFALLVQPLANLSYPRARQAWMLLATLALMMALALTIRLTQELAVRVGLRNGILLWIVLAVFVAAALNSTGVHNDIRAGSVGILLYLCWTLVAYALVRSRPWAGGVALAMATLLKLTPAAAFLWLLWLRRWRWLAAGALILVVAIFAGVPRWGFGMFGEYFNTALLPSLTAEFPRPMNQSLDAAWSRLLIPSELVQSPFNAPTAKFWLSLLSSLALTLVTARTLAQRRLTQEQLPIALGMLVLAILMLMKITWLHTLTASLFLWPLLMVHVLAAAERGETWARRAGLLACTGFFLSAAHLPVLWSALRSGPGVLLINAHLYGLLLLWWSCRMVLLASHEPTSGGDSVTTSRAEHHENQQTHAKGTDDGGSGR